MNGSALLKYGVIVENRSTAEASWRDYLTDGDVRNVYHHLKELTELGYLIREENLLEDPTKRCLYTITANGRSLENRYSHYLTIVRRSSGPARKY